jgi:hypothetical protein
MVAVQHVILRLTFFDLIVGQEVHALGRMSQGNAEKEVSWRRTQTSQQPHIAYFFQGKGLGISIR